MAPAVICPAPSTVITPPTNAGCRAVSPVPFPLSKPLSKKAYCPFKSDSLPPLVQAAAAVVTVIVAVPVFVVSVTDFAVSVTVAGVGTVAGAV